MTNSRPLPISYLTVKPGDFILTAFGGLIYIRNKAKAYIKIEVEDGTISRYTPSQFNAQFSEQNNLSGKLWILLRA